MTPRQNNERALMTRLAPLARAVERYANDALAGLRISSSAGWALVYLRRLGPDATVGELARAIAITEASLVRTLDLLERSELVSRRTDPEDRRTKRLELSAEGAALAARIDARLSELRSELLSDVADADLSTTIRVLEHLTGQLDERSSRP